MKGTILMKIYYCDGSQSKKLGKLGVGIVSGENSRYFEYDDFVWTEQTHEIVAITKAIEVALEEKANPIIVVNDDINLTRVIEKGLRDKKKRLNKSRRKFSELIDLIECHSVQVKNPVNQSERVKIKKAHDLSRTYISDNALKRLI